MKKNIFRLSVSVLVFLAVSLESIAQDLVILHTNDTHSQVDVQKSGEYAGLGGVERRYNLFQEVISKYGREIVLILDAGDYNQGSPYFTEYSGDLEVSLMNALGYDVTTLGNHEFDNGIDELARRLSMAEYQTVCCNYSFRGTPLARYVKPYTVIVKGDKTIGIIGATTDLERVSDKGITDGIKQLDAVKSINKYARKLARKCDLIILLSHRGYDTGTASGTDLEIAGKLKNVDLIIGGHSHTFMTEPVEMEDADGQRIVIVQDGWGGVNVGMMVIKDL